MKKIFTLLSIVILGTQAWAQAPQKMSYQAVIRNGSGQLVVNQTIGMQISILQGSPEGSDVYLETHTPKTNAHGLVTLEIGTGTSTGDFSAIPWANGPFFIKTETDPTGGTNYTIIGTSPLLSVPYALHASIADSIKGGTKEVDGSITNEIQTLSKSGNVVTLSKGGGSFTDSVNTYTAGDGVSITGNEISLAGDVDRSINNEIQTISKSGNTVTLSNGGGTFTDSVNTYTAGSGISISGNVISYTGGGGGGIVYTAGDGVSISGSEISLAGDVDRSVNNEIQTISKLGNTVTLSNGGGTFTDSVNTYTAGDGVNISGNEISLAGDVDRSVNNEIQTISKSGNTVTLSNGGGTFTDSVNVYTAGSGIDISGNVISTTMSSSGMYLGKDTLGGIVFHMYTGSDGQPHGLIVSKTSTNSAWQTTGTTVGADRSWDGAFNTNLMTDSPVKDWIAAEFTSEWYLPSIDELSLLWHSRYHVNKALSTAGGGATIMPNSTHLSSTESTVDKAFGFYFLSGSVNQPSKTGTFYVSRAIRAF